MEENVDRGRGMKKLISKLCFMAFGITAFSNPLDRFSLYNIGVGILVGLIFGWFFRKFLYGFLGLFNKKLKSEKGKATIHYAVDNGMMFLVPFAMMALMATFYLKWSMTSGFISAGIMAVGTSAAIEIGKLKNKQEIKNTIITSAVSFLFSYCWTFSIGLMAKAPGFIEGGINLIQSLVSKGGGSL